MQALGNRMLCSSIGLACNGCHRKDSRDKVCTSERQNMEQGESGIRNKREGHRFGEEPVKGKNKVLEVLIGGGFPQIGHVGLGRS